jgi:PAS domain S-box-containing protein
MKHRLEHLHEISKLLVAFETVEQTFDAALQIVTESLRIESAILLHVEDGSSKVILWPADRQSTAEMAAARAHVESAFAYLSGAEALDVSVTAGQTGLPVSPRPPGVDPAHHFIVLPLVVGRRRVFGALQIEAAAPPDEGDLVFVNAIANQLALALERDRAWRSDIRHRATAEALSERYEALVDNLDHAFVWEADARTLEMLYVSERAEQLLGYPRQGWLAAAEDGAVVRAAMERAVAERSDQRFDHRCRSVDGHVRWFHTRVHPTGADTDPPRLQGVSLDVTSWKAAEARVREHGAERERAAEAQRFLSEASKQLGADLGSPATLDRVSRLALPRLGDVCFVDVVSDDGSVRRSAWAHVDPAQRAELDEIFARKPVDSDHPVCRVIRTGATELVSNVDEAWTRDSAVSDRHLRFMTDRPVVSAMTVPLTLAERTLGALTVLLTESGRRHDQADLALAEELAVRAAFALDNGHQYERAQHATRVREQILEIVSHDLRVPLGTILMAADLLDEPHVPEGEDFRRLVTGMHRAAARMQRLIEDLLDFANIEAGQLSIAPRPLDPAALIEEAVTSFESAAREQAVALAAELPEAAPRVLGDRDRVLQVFSNLVGNAMKAVSAHGRVTLRAEPRDSEVLFSVSDTGSGISPEDLQRIFDRYWRAGRTTYRGAGLGLTIARGIVDAHGGRIWAESTVGEGTTFYFTIPVAKPRKSRPEEDAHDARVG